MRDTRKTWKKKGENEKGKVLQKFSNVKMTIKLFTFIFCLCKMIHFARKHSLGKCSLYCYISNEDFLTVEGYLKQRNEIPTSI